MPTIYLDHNATSPTWPEVVRAMEMCLLRGFANPASQHSLGRRARRELEESREELGRLLGVRTSGLRPDRVSFTSGGTEDNNLALLGVTGAITPNRPSRIIISTIEHPCVVGAAEELQRRGWQVDRLKVSREGLVNPNELQERIDYAQKNTDDGAWPVRLVSIMMANHETGVLQPIQQLAQVCVKNNVLFHTDAVQAAGKLKIDFQTLGVDAMTLSAHKFNGPSGVGALLLRTGLSLRPLVFGGFQQERLRPGTESLHQAVGMLTALQMWEARRSDLLDQLESLTKRFEKGLRDGDPTLLFNGRGAIRVPQTSNVAFPGVNRQALLLSLDQADICCSTGSACESGSSEPSPVLIAMGLPIDHVNSSLRFSCGPSTKPAEIDTAVSRILKYSNRLRKMP